MSEKNSGVYCIKCKTRTHHVVTTLGASTLERYAETDIYSGYSCYNCGTWINDPLVEVKPGVPSVETSLVRPKGPRPAMQGTKYTVAIGKRNQQIVEQNVEFIRERRNKGQTWEVITDDFCIKVGVDMTDTTLRRYCRPLLPPELMCSLRSKKVT